MSDLIRVETDDGNRAERGWLKDGKRHGLWIEKTAGKLTFSIYDCGEVSSAQVSAAKDGAPLPLAALFRAARKLIDR